MLNDIQGDQFKAQAQQVRESRRLIQPWVPHPVQADFLKSTAYEVLFGGQAGGGKSVGILADAAQARELSGYAAVLFRKTYKQLEEPGGLIQRSFEIYPRLGGVWHLGRYAWEFPTQTQIVVRHMQNSGDRYNYQGAEFSYIGFDQLEQFDEQDYLYLFSRARSVNPKIKARVRATANPGASWVLKRWLPWLGTDDELEEAHLKHAKAGEILWFKRVNDQDVQTDKDDPEALSRTFIPATIQDNPTLMANDPGYINRLKALPFVERRRLLDGDWHIQAQAGTMFKREWFTQFVDAAPPMTKTCRAFDLAGTEKKRAKDDPDFTATVLMGEVMKGLSYFLHAEQSQLSPMGVEDFIINFHETEDKDIPYIFEQEPGQSGKAQIVYFKRLLKGRAVYGLTAGQQANALATFSKDKITRASPLSSDAEGGLLVMVRAAWNTPLLTALVNFPSEQWHDDLVDAAALCHHFLKRMAMRAKVVRLGG